MPVGTYLRVYDRCPHTSYIRFCTRTWLQYSYSRGSMYGEGLAGGWSPCGQRYMGTEGIVMDKPCSQPTPGA